MDLSNGMKAGCLSLDLSLKQEVKPLHDVGNEEIALGAKQFKTISFLYYSPTFSAWKLFLCMAVTVSISAI